jgi:hypothetical protein
MRPRYSNYFHLHVVRARIDFDDQSIPTAIHGLVDPNPMLRGNRTKVALLLTPVISPGSEGCSGSAKRRDIVEL